MAGQLMAGKAEGHLVYRARWGSMGVEWAMCREVNGQRGAESRSAPPSPRRGSGWREWEEVEWTRLAPMVLPLGAWMFATRVAIARAETYASKYRNLRIDQRWQVLALVAWKRCWEQSKKSTPKTGTEKETAAAAGATRGAKRRAREERRRREVSLERKEALVERLAREQERNRLVELAHHTRRIRAGQEAVVLTILESQISQARREFRRETREVQRERRELERDRWEMENAEGQSEQYSSGPT